MLPSFEEIIRDIPPTTGPKQATSAFRLPSFEEMTADIEPAGRQIPAFEDLTDTTLDRQGVAKAFLKSLWAGELHVAAGVVGTIKAMPVRPGIARKLGEMQANIYSMQKRFAVNPQSATEWGARVVGEAVPYMGAAFAAGVMGGVGAAAAVGFAVEGEDAYQKAKQAGVSEGRAQAERVVVGSINAAIEAWQIGRLLKFKHAGNHSLKNFSRLVRAKAWRLVAKEGGRFTGDLLRTAVVEGIEEMLQEGVSMTAELSHGDVPRKEDGTVDFGYILKRIGEAGLGGAVAGGVLGTAASISGLHGAVAPSTPAIKGMHQQIEQSDLSPFEKNRCLRELKTLSESVQAQTAVPGAAPVAPEVTVSPEFQETLNIIKRVETDLAEMEMQRPAERENIKLETGKRFAEYEKILQETADPILADWFARQALQGEMKLQFTPLNQKYSAEDMQHMWETVRSSRLNQSQKLDLFGALNKIFIEGKLPYPSEIKTFDKFFGTNIRKTYLRHMPAGKKAWRQVINAMNLPRALLTSMDFSAAGRQGLLLLPVAPKQWAKAAFHGYRAWLNPDYADFMRLQIETDPFYEQFRESKGFLSEWGSREKGEDVFISEFAHKIPGVRASERAYTTTLNSLRFYTFKMIAEQWAGTGKTKKDYDTLVSFINHATGRGDLGRFEKYAAELNATFFAPRLVLGRFQLFSDLITATSPVRKIIAADLVKSFGILMTVLGLAKLRGMDVELNPASSDFLKIKRGNTRLDLMAGYQQIFRLMWSMVIPKRKSTTTGVVTDIERTEVIKRFIQSKLSPVAGTAVELYTGETFQGKRVEATPEFVGEQLWERLMPLFIQDVTDAIRYQGLDGLAMVAPLAIHGIGAQTYTPTAMGDATKAKHQYALEVFGTQWDDLGPDAQDVLREARPMIKQLEDKAKIEGLDYVLDSRLLDDQRISARRMRKSLALPIRKELDRLNVNVSGVARRLGTDWVLNDKRFKELETQTKINTNIILSKLIHAPQWSGFSDEVQKALAEEAIKAAREFARERIVTEATAQDLQQIQQWRTRGSKQ